MAGPLTRQAQSEALVRYGPQRFALRELLQQAVTTRDLALHAASGAERAIQHTISLARNETARNYASAGATTTGTREMVGQALQALGPAGSPFAAAIAREQGGAQDRLTEGQANSLQDLTNRRLEATSGRAYATQAATRQFNTDVGKVGRTYEELAAEQGAFTQGRVGELKKEQADRQFQRDLAQFNQGEQDKRARIGARTQRRGQDLSHTDRQAAIQQRRQAAAQKGRGNRIGTKGPKLASQSAHAKLFQDIQTALPDAQGLKAHLPYDQTRKTLTSGVPASTEKKGTTTVHHPALKSNPYLASIVASDIAYYGGITQHTMNVLHSQGFSTRQLRLKRARITPPAPTAPHILSGDTLGG